MFPFSDPAASSFMQGVDQPVTTAGLASIGWQVVVERVGPLAAIEALHFSVLASALASEGFFSAPATGEDSILVLIDSRFDFFGDPVEPLATVRGADAVCSQNGRPAGVAFSLQVCRYSVEPTFANRVCNLLAKYVLRAALADEVEEGGPEVSWVGVAETFPCG
jgi:hypothetical protein